MRSAIKFERNWCFFMEIICSSPLSGSMREQTRAFLQDAGLDWDEAVQTTINLVENGAICATGSRQDNMLKCIAVNKLHEGEGLTATVVSELIKNAFMNGHRHLFLFTKPENMEKFGSLGFYPIAETKDVILLENLKKGVETFVERLEKPKTEGITGAIVANCNPFTNGHRFLIETAAKSCGLVHLFILSEDRSSFPTHVRLELAKQGTADIDNVVVHPTSSYMVSSATFPDYFIKDKVKSKKINCELDLTIFAECFAKPMGIQRRYVGSEPNDPVTASYNQQMHNLLPALGVDVIEIPRLQENGAFVSASTVRRLLAQGSLEKLRALLPPTTYAYLERM